MRKPMKKSPTQRAAVKMQAKSVKAGLNRGKSGKKSGKGIRGGAIE